nr:long-chain fatty acid transport protein 4-like [Cherax quadricarinatus]XP_053626716.1 long-chain fatty acid transport protein 4-like [Cherax quadricarinatus]XP_053626717.1 long-chain fatty acid transport protein 4-like [Cherax quadricarinatus]XP_053626718.1 long-chain fatty acid transport protein 4-like [Cherax quadricarinatus]XP_053626719.1 long-chain fatty acid transport protein 4-like [Cherax quadricarinatus]
MVMWRTAAIIGVTSALWAAGKQELSIGGILLPKLSCLQFLSVAAGIYITTGGYYTLWLAYKTLPRDLVAGFRYLKVRLKLNWALYCNHTVPKLFMENVRRNPNKVALIFEGQKWTFAQIDEYSNRVGNFLVERGYKHGDTVALFMYNRPEYVCVWLGCAKVGVVPALINFNLRQLPLMHSVQVADSKAIICGEDLQEATGGILDKVNLPVYVSGCDKASPSLKGAENLDSLLCTSSPTPPPQIDSLSAKDKLIYIYTSGTTGLPKAAIIKHYRYMFFSSGVHYMIALGDDEVLYNPLPLYHSAGGMVGIGQVLLFNNTAVIRQKFSASQYWVEAKKYDCTVAQYVGEICRYLLKTPEKPEDKQHKVRVMFGNGVRPQIWTQFTSRFNMPCIAEFYGATESISNIMNIEGKPGACGFVSVLFRHAYPAYLIKIDEETGEPLRDKNGLCILCKPGEAGEFVALIRKNHPILDFHGYADKKATEKKVAKDIMKKGDMAFRSSDILIMDELGYLYFKDRTGDTFRWRGENVSSTEVEGVVSKVAGNKDAVVYGVEVPGAEGRAGMAAVVDPEGELNLQSFKEGIKEALPSYACPLFLRVLQEIDVTGTFKLKKLSLQKEGFNPTIIKDKLYFFDAKLGKYVELTVELFNKIDRGQAGL